MKAAVIHEYHRPVSIDDVPIPSPGPHEVVVRVGGSGLCASDLHILEGMVGTVKLPFTPGHELAGVVFETGSQAHRFEPGDRVVGAIDILCGSCRFCRTGRGNLCANLTRMGFERNGAHAEYTVIPEDNLIKIPDSIPFEQAAIIPDAVACMLRAIKVQGNVRLGDRVIILGIGGLGMQGVQIAKLSGASVYCTSRTPRKLEMALGLGADVAMNPLDVDVETEVMRLTEGDGCDVVFDNVGVSESMDLAMKLCRRGGRIVVVGWSAPSFSISFQDIIMREKEIVGTRASTRQDLIEAVRLVGEGKVTPLVTDVFPLADINRALEKLAAGKILGRGVLIPS
jgi:2-desacetyl-2-hydroxyethyl bacteriochlorophyllide A dehydrogenase